MSIGASKTPAIAADTATTVMLKKGVELSRIVEPPRLREPKELCSVDGSDTLSSALKKLLAQVCIVFNRMPYTNVLLVPFQTPNTPSLFHSCEITSNTESGCFRMMC